jgi:hypothetical protein
MERAETLLRETLAAEGIPIETALDPNATD